MSKLIIFYVSTIILWSIMFFRNVLFDVIGVFLNSRTSYEKSRAIDVGLCIMFGSLIIGGTAFMLTDALSVEITSTVIVLGSCVGCIFVAKGLGEEWRQNKK